MLSLYQTLMNCYIYFLTGPYTVIEISGGGLYGGMNSMFWSCQGKKT
jgi:hypothetical protein